MIGDREICSTCSCEEQCQRFTDVAVHIVVKDQGRVSATISHPFVMGGLPQPPSSPACIKHIHCFFILQPQVGLPSISATQIHSEQWFPFPSCTHKIWSYHLKTAQKNTLFLVTHVTIYYLNLLKKNQRTNFVFIILYVKTRSAEHIEYNYVHDMFHLSHYMYKDNMLHLINRNNNVWCLNIL